MAFTAAAVTVASTATLVVAYDGSEQSTVIRNYGTQSVFLGASDVTTGTGYPLLPGETFPADLIGVSPVYGIVASGTCEVRVAKVAR